MWKASVVLGLALTLCIAVTPCGAATDACASADSGLVGGYSTLDAMPAEVVDATVEYFVENLAANVTNWAPCDPDELQVSAAGCSQVGSQSPGFAIPSPALVTAAPLDGHAPLQVVAGTNYEVQLNVTCPVAGTTTVGLQAALFQPLPYTGQPIQVGAQGCRLQRIAEVPSWMVVALASVSATREWPQPTAPPSAG